MFETGINVPCSFANLSAQNIYVTEDYDGESLVHITLRAYGIDNISESTITGIGNLVSMATLIAKGMRPRTWWRAERARESARRGMLGWLSLLVLLAVALVFSRRFG